MLGREKQTNSCKSGSCPIVRFIDYLSLDQLVTLKSSIDVLTSLSLSLPITRCNYIDKEGRPEPDVWTSSPVDQ
jgi:hypothetical protein